MTEEAEIIESTGIDVIEAQQRAEYDQQIATAKKYPRDLVRVKNNCIAIVTMSDEMAAKCRYSLPRGGKNVTGPSVHLASVLAQQYGNIRVDARVKQVTGDQVISEAVAFDLETNYACKIEVRRSIISVNKETKKKTRYSDDMITVTGNAANSIAFRNAVLKVIPTAITTVVYDAAMQKMSGDLSDENKLIAARKKALDHFKEKYDISEERILKQMGLNSVNQLKQDQILDLRAMAQALKDGDISVSEMFPETEKGKGTSQSDKVDQTFAKGSDHKDTSAPESVPAGENKKKTTVAANPDKQKAGVPGVESKGKLF